MLRESLMMAAICAGVVSCAEDEGGQRSGHLLIEFVGETGTTVIDLDQDGSMDTVTIGDGRIGIGSRTLLGEVDLGVEESVVHLTSIADLNADGILDLIVVATSVSGYSPEFVVNSNRGPSNLRMAGDLSSPDFAYGSVVVAGDFQYECDVLAQAQPRVLLAGAGRPMISIPFNRPPPDVDVQDPCTGFPHVEAVVSGDSLILADP